MLGVTFQANGWFLAVVIVLAGTLLYVLQKKNVKALSAQIGNVKVTVDEINSAVNNVEPTSPPIKEHAAKAAVKVEEVVSKIDNQVVRSLFTIDRKLDNVTGTIEELRRHQADTFGAIDAINGRLDGHAQHMAGLGARISAFADQAAAGFTRKDTP